MTNPQRVSRIRRSLTPALLLTLAAAGAATAQNGAINGVNGHTNGHAAEQAQVPIRAITLYRSGVGSFERRALIDGSSTVGLSFDTDQINDILKSMVLLDLDGGEFGPVTYESKEPLSKRLASFGIDLSKAPELGDILQQLRGTRVRLGTASGPVEGTILSVELRQYVEQAGDAAATVRRNTVTLVTDRGIEAVAVDRANSIELLDEELASELTAALAAIDGQRSERVKSVELSLLGEVGKQRRVLISYVHEMPVWKTSYRLVLPESPGDEATMQGWAIVENTTDEDWQNVRLSLASGRPVGFRMDLYEPVFAPRPTLPVPIGLAAAARVFEAGRIMYEVDSLSVVERKRMQTVGSEGIADFAAASPSEESAGSAAIRRELAFPGSRTLASGMQNQSRGVGEDVGGQFLYTVTTPVTLERQRSAMLPVIQGDVEARRVSIYNEQQDAQHPMLGIDFRNTSGLQLLAGPVAVYDSGRYAGDAQIPHVSRDQEQLLAYATDLDVVGDVENQNTSSVQSFRVVDGVLIQTNNAEWTRTYSFTNRSQDRGRQLVVEVPRQRGWDLIQPEAETVEETSDLYRFDVALEAGGEASLDVVQQREQFTRLALLDTNVNTLLSLSRSGKMSADVSAAIREALRLRGEVTGIERQIAAANTRLEEIEQDQRRIRDNMNRLDRNSQLYNRYVSKLNEQEDEVESLLESRDQLDEQKKAADAKLRTYVRTLDVS
ncbi:MAG: hypothetical protein AAGD00_06170 [Planctomycetota bacterium]